MSKFPSYATGTVSVAAGDTVIVGTGTIWSGVNARAGDDIIIAGHTVIVEDVTDPTHLVIDPWPYATVAPGAAYRIVQRSPLRFAGGQAMADVSALVAALNADGFYVFVASTLSAPDPSYGNENQFAFQASTGKLWLKTGGAWVFQGIYKGFNIRGAYDNASNYAIGDVVAFSGSSYVWTNPASGAGHAPPDATYWQLLAAKGADGVNGGVGATGPQGASYGGTSTTSLAIGAGAKAFTTQAGLAYQNGARVRATVASDATKWMEGTATYADTTLTIMVDKVGGTGTFASWNFNVVGQPGAGDLSSANNGSDFGNVDTALSNLRGISYGVAQTLTASQQAQASANVGAIAFAVAQSLTAAQKRQALRNIGAPVLLTTIVVPNGGGVLADTTSLTNEFDEYELVFQDLVPSVTSQTAMLQVQAGGAFQNSGYRCSISEVNDVNNGTANFNATAGILLTNVNNTNNLAPGISGRFRIRSPAATDRRKTIYGLTASNTQGAAARSARVSGFWDGGNNAVTGFQISVTNGNVLSGTIKLYGIP